METRSIGIQCNLLEATSLQNFGTEFFGEPLSTSDIEEGNLDTSFPLTQERSKYKCSLALQLTPLTQNRENIMVNGCHIIMHNVIILEN